VYHGNQNLFLPKDLLNLRFKICNNTFAMTSIDAGFEEIEEMESGEVHGSVFMQEPLSYGICVRFTHKCRSSIKPFVGLIELERHWHIRLSDLMIESLSSTVHVSEGL
jgi:hypothetical protein